MMGLGIGQLDFLLHKLGVSKSTNCSMFSGVILQINPLEFRIQQFGASEVSNEAPGGFGIYSGFYYPPILGL